MVQTETETERFLATIFDEGQTTCFTATPYGHAVSNFPKSKDLFYCINALHPYQDLNPSAEWHSPTTPRRADINVICFRNFLIELDHMPLNQQVEYVTSKLPVTSIIYSGGSSYHFIISLVTPLLNYTEYMNWSKRIHLMVPEADKATKNPSRLSRLPDVIRPDTDKMQTLHYLGSRIDNLELATKLPTLDTISFSGPMKAAHATPLILAAAHEPQQIMVERGLKGRNQFFYWLGCRMADSQLDPEKRLYFASEAYKNLPDVSGFSFEEALMAARIPAGKMVSR
jgi:hypothetical protein